MSLALARAMFISSLLLLLELNIDPIFITACLYYVVCLCKKEKQETCRGQVASELLCLVERASNQHI